VVGARLSGSSATDGMAVHHVSFREILVTLAHVLAWYVFSIGITFYNKWLFKVRTQRVRRLGGTVGTAAILFAHAEA